MNVINFPPKIKTRSKLSLAIEKMEQALEDQSEAVANFQSTNIELKECIDTIKDSMIRFDNSLSRINVRKLGKLSRKLSDTMEPHAVFQPQ